MELEEPLPYFSSEPCHSEAQSLPVQSMLWDIYKPAESLIHLAFGHAGEYLGRGGSLSCLRLVSSFYCLLGDSELG